MPTTYNKQQQFTQSTSTSTVPTNLRLTKQQRAMIHDLLHIWGTWYYQGNQLEIKKMTSLSQCNIFSTAPGTPSSDGLDDLEIACAERLDTLLKRLTKKQYDLVYALYVLCLNRDDTAKLFKVTTRTIYSWLDNVQCQLHALTTIRDL